MKFIRHPKSRAKRRNQVVTNGDRAGDFALTDDLAWLTLDDPVIPSLGPALVELQLRLGRRSIGQGRAQQAWIERIEGVD